MRSCWLMISLFCCFPIAFAGYGSELLQTDLLATTHYKIDIRALHFSYSPLFLIEIGLLLLVATQILRVFLLVIYYATIRDYKFTMISSFALIVLLFSFIAQK